VFLRYPFGDDADTVTLCRLLMPQLVVVVAPAGLGTINDVRLTVDALAGNPVVVVLNRFEADDDLHVRNLEWLAGRDRFAVVTDPDDLDL
jgi:dethiobiotin synthetase